MTGRSSELDKLAGALIKAQGEFPALVVDESGQVGSRKYKYATLAHAIEVARPVCVQNGLAVIQTCEPDDTDTLRLTTTLLHASGQWVAGTARFPMENNTPQGMGSAMTYARRYQYLAILGIAPSEDDDGAEASKPRLQSIRGGKDPLIERATEMLDEKARGRGLSNDNGAVGMERDSSAPATRNGRGPQSQQQRTQSVDVDEQEEKGTMAPYAAQTCADATNEALAWFHATIMDRWSIAGKDVHAWLLETLDVPEVEGVRSLRKGEWKDKSLGSVLDALDAEVKASTHNGGKANEPTV